MLFPIAAAQLSVTDLRDLRCVYVFQTAATALTGDERSAIQGTQQWFEGRLSARQPKLNVFDYVNEHFTFRKVGVGDADLLQCSQIFTDWEAQEIAGKEHK
jgi:hypothetical protein